MILVLRAQPHAPYVQRITDPPRFTCHRTSERPLRGPPVLTTQQLSTYSSRLRSFRCCRRPALNALAHSCSASLTFPGPRLDPRSRSQVSADALLQAFGAAGFIGCAAASVVFGALASREKSLRGKVLVRLDRELSVGDLSIMQPGSAVGTGRQARALSAFRNTMRVVAVAGAPSTLLDEVRRAAVYKRRLAQSSVALVCVPFDEANDAAAAEWSKVSRLCEGQGWLWQPADPPRWRAYYEEILRARAAARRLLEGSVSMTCPAAAVPWGAPRVAVDALGARISLLLGLPPGLWRGTPYLV